MTNTKRTVSKWQKNFKFGHTGHHPVLLYHRSYPEYFNCEIVAVPAKYDFKPYGWGFQKGSPYVEIFNYYLDEMKEKGSLKQIFVKYDPPPQVRNHAA